MIRPGLSVVLSLFQYAHINAEPVNEERPSRNDEFSHHKKDFLKVRYPQSRPDKNYDQYPLSSPEQGYTPERTVCKCLNGNAATGTSCPTNGAAKCASCKSGYFLSNDSCAANQCSCLNGNAATGDSCPTNEVAKCASCKSGYFLSGDSCAENQCSCLNGNGAAGTACSTNGDAKCASCESEYFLSGDSCVACCLNGSFEPGTACSDIQSAKCVSCNSGYELEGDTCIYPDPIESPKILTPNVMNEYIKTYVQNNPDVRGSLAMDISEVLELPITGNYRDLAGAAEEPYADEQYEMVTNRRHRRQTEPVKTESEIKRENNIKSKLKEWNDDIKLWAETNIWNIYSKTIEYDNMNGKERDILNKFSLSEEKPECKELIGHVRIQTCNECWAMTSVGIMQDNMCINDLKDYKDATDINELLHSPMGLLTCCKKCKDSSHKFSTCANGFADIALDNLRAIKKDSIVPGKPDKEIPELWSDKDSRKQYQGLNAGGTVRSDMTETRVKKKKCIAVEYIL